MKKFDFDAAVLTIAGANAGACLVLVGMTGSLWFAAVALAIDGVLLLTRSRLRKRCQNDDMTDAFTLASRQSRARGRALAIAAETFDEYAAQHRAKPVAQRNLSKVLRNVDMAAMCRSALD